MKIKKSIKSKKILSRILIVFMLFQICQINGFSAQKVFADTGFRHQKINNDVVLGGNYIEVGVSKAGSFGTASEAPSGFHSSYDGMYQGYSGVGLRVDGDGFDIGKAPTTGDFFLPGTPEESFTVGYRAGSEGAAPTKYTNAERMNLANISTVTTDTTSGETLSATTSGTTSDNNLDIKQKVSFKVNDKFFKNTITYTNKGTSTLYDVRYMRSFDPDQDSVLSHSSNTYNCVLENFPQDSRAIVRASGAVSKEPIFFISTDSRARASNFGFINRDPYASQAYNTDGSKLKSPEALVDQAIAITFSLGNLAPGQSTTFQYYTSLDPSYSDGLAAIMGSLGLKINDGAAATSNKDVTLNLSADSATQMQFSNDGITWSEWEPYVSTKAWKLTDGDGIKTVYVQFKDNADSISCANASITYDVASPTIISVSGIPTSWTKNDVTITVNAMDAGSGLNTAGAYSFNGGSWTTENSKGFSENGTVNIRVRDNSGNITSQDVVINKIDKSAPTFTGITSTPTTWTNSGVILTVNSATDNDGAGLDALAYSFSTTKGVYNWQASEVSPAFSTNQPVYVYVRDALGNISSVSTENITTIDKVLPVITKVTSNTSDWTKGDVTLTVDASDALSGLADKPYSFDGGSSWQAESTMTYTENTSNIVVKVKDAAGNIAAYSPINIANIDKTAPENAEIKVQDRSFTSLLNKITFGIFFKNTVNVSISADDKMSGIKKIEYQKVAMDTDYDPNGKWISGSSFNVTPDDKFIVYARITDNVGNYVIINSDGIVVDSSNPDLALTSDASDWTQKDINIKVEASDKLSGVKEVTYTTDEKIPQTGTVDLISGAGTIKLSNEGQYKLTVTARDNSLNEVSQTVDVKIDRTKPKFSGASEASGYYVGRVIRITDDLGEIAGAAYKKDAAGESSFNDGTLFDKAGKYVLIVKDKAGNSAEMSFEIKALPEVEDIVYTEECKALIERIRAEFNSHNDLPEPYKTNMDNKIKALEIKYSDLDKEVKDIKSETSVIKGKVDVLPNGTDGLLKLQKEIQDEYNKIAGDTSTLTKEQKAALENEALYLKQLLDITDGLQNQIDSIKTSVSNIDTKVDGLISKEDKIKELLGDIYKLTKEQQSILQPQIDFLNGLLGKINTLKEEVEAVKDMINNLPSAEKITKQDMNLVTNANNAYNKLTNEQKSLVGEDLAKYLNDCLDALRKLMLHNAPNDVTVTGIDGTTFASDVYLIVTPFKADSKSTEFADSAAMVKKAADTISEIKGKELVALYDVSLFKDNVKIQPDGKVKVKIKIPDNLIGRAGLDIVHVADDGTVTTMHAVVEDGYLVFTTTHFSNYGIVAQPIVKALPKTGSPVDSNLLLLGGALFIVAGMVVIGRQRRKKLNGIE